MRTLTLKLLMVFDAVNFANICEPSPGLFHSQTIPGRLTKMAIYKRCLEHYHECVMRMFNIGILKSTKRYCSGFVDPRRCMNGKKYKHIRIIQSTLSWRLVDGF